jgi:GDP-D-mannose 3',5'-epimerase
MKSEGYHVICVDWKRNEYMKETDFCHEFKLLDLRDLASCVEATKGCEWVFNLAADMGGYGNLPGIFCFCRIIVFLLASLAWASSRAIIL